MINQVSQRHLLDFDYSGQQSIQQLLWSDFLARVLPGLILSGNHPNNPVVTFITSYAPTEPPLFSAVMFLTYSIQVKHYSLSCSLLTLFR